MIDFEFVCFFTKRTQICIAFGNAMNKTDIKDHFELIAELPEGASDSKIQNKLLNCVYLHY